MTELVTGEAVALELRPAKLPSRALGQLIDLVVAAAGYLAVMMAVLASTSSLDDAAEAAIAVASFLLLLVGGPIAVETLSHGRSLGKLACGLRVVRDDGGPIRFRHALARGAVGVVEILLSLGVIACIASLVSARGRRMGDVLAGTLVVRERVPGGPGGLLPEPPPWLAGRFSALDLSGVPDGLWLAVRQYLVRTAQLDPQVGSAMAERLATDVVTHTGTPPPQGVPPAAFLAAVLHERQARESQRAFGGAVPSTRGVFGVQDPPRVEGTGSAETFGRPDSVGWEGSPGGAVGVGRSEGASAPGGARSPAAHPVVLPATAQAASSWAPPAGSGSEKIGISRETGIFDQGRSGPGAGTWVAGPGARTWADPDVGAGAVPGSGTVEPGAETETVPGSGASAQPGSGMSIGPRSNGAEAEVERTAGGGGSRTGFVPPA